MEFEDTEALTLRLDNAMLVFTADTNGHVEVTRATFLSVEDAAAILHEMADAMLKPVSPNGRTPDAD